MATYTSAQATAGKVRNLETGIQYAQAGPIGTGGVSLSAGDVFVGVPVPHGAIVTHIDVWGNVPGVSAGLLLGVGDGGSTSRFGSVSMSATAQMVSPPMPTGPYRYSLSDNLVPRFDTIDLIATTVGSSTLTASLFIGVAYYMPPA